MNRKTIFLITAFFILIFSLTILFFKLNKNDETLKVIEEKVSSFNVYKVNDCEIIMNQQNLSYALCTMREDETIVLKDRYLNCSVAIKNIIPCEKSEFITTFRPLEYLGLQVNMLKFDIPFDSYYACMYTNFPLYSTAFPSRYTEAKAGINFPRIFCSSKLNKKDYYNFALSGYVLNKKGEYNIIRIYVFDGSLPQNYNFKNNLDKGLKIFELKGEVI
ncbi:MAG: hypothetical protein QXL86_02670 [Candidatus Aenigmatarchaeota archaeon]